MCMVLRGRDEGEWEWGGWEEKRRRKGMNKRGKRERESKSARRE